MYFIGELRDEAKAKEILRELEKRGSSSTLQYLKEHDLWAIYVHLESDIEPAREIYRVKLGLKKPIEIDQEWTELKKVPIGFYTKVAIVISVILFLVSYSKLGDSIYAELMFSSPLEKSLFENISHFEFYRLITPIFLHMNILHILFNMLWFKDLASLLENKFPIKFFFIFILVSAIISNLLQYIVQGPRFGGMSGVLYGLLGFFWIYKKSHNGFNYGIPDRDMKIMLFWFVLCLTGFLGPIANLAHAGGLSFGMIMAIGIGRDSLSYSISQQLKVIFVAILILLATIFIEGFKLKGVLYFQKNLEQKERI